MTAEIQWRVLHVANRGANATTVLHLAQYVMGHDVVLQYTSRPLKIQGVPRKTGATH
jgi:hypothetical protein